MAEEARRISPSLLLAHAHLSDLNHLLSLQDHPFAVTPPPPGNQQPPRARLRVVTPPRTTTRPGGGAPHPGLLRRGPLHRLPRRAHHHHERQVSPDAATPSAASNNQCLSSIALHGKHTCNILNFAYTTFPFEKQSASIKRQFYHQLSEWEQSACLNPLFGTVVHTTIHNR